jgi:transcription antitermination factor NusG
MNWYTLRVISGKEKKIKENILFEVNTANMDDYMEKRKLKKEYFSRVIC